MTATTQQSEWLPKAAAAKLAGISVRQLERREAQGYIEKRTLPRRPMDRTAAVEYSRADLLALKAGTPNVHARPVPDSEREQGSQNLPLALVPAKSNAGADPFAGLPAFFAQLAAAYPGRAASAPAKPWLTLQEAAEYSGLPAAHLVAQARAGNPFAVNVGTGRKAFWRFNRDAIARVAG